MRLRLEDFFRNVAQLEDSEFQPILDAAVDRYVQERRHQFHKYLLSELTLHPYINRISLDNGLLEILEVE
jgi:hypothetical protein